MKGLLLALSLLLGSDGRLPVVHGVDELIHLAPRRGPVVLHFWATWCGACVRDMPKVHELARKLGQLGIPLVGASLDAPAKEEEVMAFLEKAQVGFDAMAILDSPSPQPIVDRLDPAWNAQLPATFLLDGSGKTVAAYLGPTPVEKILSDARRLRQ
ncbi:MAG: TlpA disulfide reductase family protein [Deltaproteobacteria bacterium]